MLIRQTGGKEAVGGCCSNTSEKSCGPNSSYNKDGEEFRHLRDTLEIKAQVWVVSQLLVVVMLGLHPEKFLWISQFRISYGGHSDLKWALQNNTILYIKE